MKNKNIKGLNWKEISCESGLTEEFIEKFQDRVDWANISIYQRLSEEFIEKFRDRVDWWYISANQRLSESFIEKFQDRVDWANISRHQRLSEEFMEKFQDRVNWGYISANQRLSESFIEKFQDRVDWANISIHQRLSEEFMEKFRDRIDIEIQKRKHFDKRTYNQKRKEAIKYCKKFNLEYFEDYFLAYRQHDAWGRGMFNCTNFYEVGKYYRDWHCDLDENCKISFGLGIFPEGNVKVKVKYEDWGVWVKDTNKSRVWGVEIIKQD